MVKKFVKIHGLAISLYREAPYTSTKGRPVLVKRKLVEPAWIELWFKATEGEWDDTLWEQLSDDNKDWFAYCFHMTEQNDNKELEIALSKKFKKTQQRLNLLEGMVMAGNMNDDLVNEFKSILDSLVASYQLPLKQGSRMKKRLDRTYEMVKRSSN